MGFKEVSSLDSDVTYALGKIDKATGKPYPKQAEGYYLGSRVVQNKRGESKLHFLQTPKGNVGIWGTTDLNRKLSQGKTGMMVRITSTGTKPTPNGDMYTYKVEYDSANTIEVETPSEDDTAFDAPSAGADDSDPKQYDNDDEDAAYVASQRQKVTKVQEALGFKKR